MIFNQKAQAFTEALFILPIMVVLIFFIIWTARVLLTWQQLITATRYGTDMIVNTNLSSNDIKTDIENYLTHKNIEGRRLDINKIKEINVDIKQYGPIDISFKNLPNLFNNSVNIVKGIVLPTSQMSSVSITYIYELPKFLNIVGLKEFEIKTKLSVLAGSGCKNDIHKRKK